MDRRRQWWVTAVLLVSTVAATSAKEMQIARVLNPVKGYDEFTFRSTGGKILIAEIQSEIYQSTGRKGGDHDDHSHDGEEAVDISFDALSSAGGCADGDHEEGGCSGGPGGLCLQVLDPDGGLVGWAGRPMRPGWMRDPQLACVLPDGYQGRDFILRIRKGGCGNPLPPEVLDANDSAPVIYVITVRLLDHAEEGRLEAVAQGAGFSAK